MSLSIRETYLPFGRPDFGEEEIAAVTRVLRSGWIGMGPETIAFEQELSSVIGAPQVVAVSSCTAAMSLCLRTLGVGPGDEVICPSLTWCSTANAALYQGAQPVFCDIDPATFCVTPDSILARVTARTKAVMIVHFGGFAVDVDRLRSMLPDRVSIVEDAAHAMGARYPNGRPVGSSGNLVCYSFYANKNISTGEGGGVATFDEKIADHIRSLRQHALPINAWKRFTHAQTVLLSQQLTELGYKANYTDLQAALGRVQLRRLPAMSALRLKLTRRYLTKLAGLAPQIEPQAGLADLAHARHLFPIRIKPASRLARDQLLLELRQRNIGATVHYALLHLMPLYNSTASLPATESIGREILTLPIGASMTIEDIDYVCGHLGALVS
jgi:dTDP-4-amino-4,6-dideoxygalactose transaminase